MSGRKGVVGFVFVGALSLWGCTSATDVPTSSESDVVSGGAPPAVVVLHLNGAYDSFFTSADSFAENNAFGVTFSNFVRIGEPGAAYGIDKSTLGSLSLSTLDHTATVGVRHGRTTDAEAQRALWFGEEASYPARLAGALSPEAHPQALLVGDFPSEMASEGLASVTTRAELEAQQPRLSTLAWDEIAHAYGADGSSFDDIREKFAAAEAAVRSGAQFVGINDDGWDTHGDRTGTKARRKMHALMPALRTFTSRMLGESSNVTLAIVGDFSHAPDGQQHLGVVSATVIGPRVLSGSTARFSANGELPPTTPGPAAFWAYLADVSGVEGQPFGVDAHERLVARP